MGKISEEDETEKRDFLFKYSKNQVCARAMIVLEKIGFAPQMMRSGERFEDYNKNELMQHKDMVIEPWDLYM